MSVATEKFTELQDQVLDLVARVQEPVVDGLRTVVGQVEERVPEVKVPGLGETLPTATELVENGFGFAERVLENQKQFAEAVLDATAPVRSKFVPAEAPGPKAAPKAKAA